LCLAFAYSIPSDEQDIAYGIHGDARFGSVRTESKVGAWGHEGVFQVMQYSARYPEDFICSRQLPHFHKKEINGEHNSHHWFGNWDNLRDIFIQGCCR
jgi:hypothetical protein